MAKRSQGNSRRVKMIPLMSDKTKELEKEIASLKEQLKREQDCVDFYADKDNWVDMEVLGYLSSIRNDEQYGNEFGESKHLCVGGKLARSTQARREK